MNKPSRRAVVRTGVWAVPVVTTVGIAPFAAATGMTCTDVCISTVGSGCKLPGHSTDTFYGYRMLVTFINCTGSDQPVTITDFKIDGKPLVDKFGEEKPPEYKNPKSIVVPKDCSTPTTGLPANGICTFDTVTGCVSYTLAFVVRSTSSSQRYATIYYTAAGVEKVATVVFPKFNPCDCNGGDPTDPHTVC